MEHLIKVYNNISRKKETFVPINSPFVGMYVCGPTVYNDVHLGNVRTFVSFDVIYRYLQYYGYKVRYVRNITDVGHLTEDENAEDKMLKQAKLMQVEPMEVAQLYTNNFHEVLYLFNCLPPNIEPIATGHILEQIEMTQAILAAGFAYEIDGSVYFDVEKFNKKVGYGKLSGRKIEDLIANTRDLDGQENKRNNLDFALWKKANPEHLMRWKSPWGEGFPGWHLECSVMSTKYLGANFDIHGGGMDLKFPHHECEIAQNQAATHYEGARYWLHTNMLTVNGQKMSKSLGNGFLPAELITGDHPVLERGYAPMVIRFFMLQTHYSSTLDFSNEALDAAEKAYFRLMNAWENLNKLSLTPNANLQDAAEMEEVNRLCEACHQSMNDDFNTAMTIANLFELSRKINAYNDGKLALESLDEPTFARLQATYNDFIQVVLGLKNEQKEQGGKLTDGLMDIILDIRKAARENKDWTTSDLIRDRLNTLNVVVKDAKEATTWSVN